MEDYRNQFIAIIAGYEREMDWFLSTNPGLPSRFPIHIRFPDYSARLLMDIAKKMALSRHYRLTTDTEIQLRQHVEHMLSKRVESFSNARWVRNTIEAAIRKQSVRLFDRQHLTREDMMLLLPQDFDLEVSRS